ncbi:MAG TPA: hypothetical protein VFC17_05795 [Candidatus Limnocylindrales bacterium]|nr:hypothetical protein [Candidatus Limnocylindrales bacterium]
MSRLEEIADDELWALAVHEAGHFLVVTELRIPSEPHIKRKADGAYEGELAWEHFDGTPDERSAVAWAGAMAEAMTGARSPGISAPFPLSNRVPLAKANLTDWCAVMLYRFHYGKQQGYLSYGDQILVCKGSDVFKTARTAFKILSANVDRLFTLAERLYHNTHAAERLMIKTSSLLAVRVVVDN